jgi:tRNA pseudouridine13 synthase
LLPHEPPLQSAELPPTGGLVGPDPEDFSVDEIPAYEPSGSGEHSYIRISKRLWTTPDMIDAVARAAGVTAREVGAAGMKDKHAVTSQWISLPLASRPVDSWELPEGLNVLQISRHTNKLRTGHLRANRFRIRLVGVVDDAAGRAQAIADRLRQSGLTNYFGGQRFGHGGRNLAEAIRWLGSGKELRGRRRRFYAKLYPSVIQAEVFNRYLTARREHGIAGLLAGEVVRLRGSTSVFVVEDPERELSRLASGDILLSGPIVGPKANLQRGEPLQMEESAIQSLGLTRRQIESWGRLAPGTWRDLLVVLENLEVTEPAPNQLTLEFSLPAGSYATELLRQFTHAPHLAGARSQA